MARGLNTKTNEQKINDHMKINSHIFDLSFYICLVLHKWLQSIISRCVWFGDGKHFSQLNILIHSIQLSWWWLLFPKSNGLRSIRICHCFHQKFGLRFEFLPEGNLHIEKKNITRFHWLQQNVANNISITYFSISGSIVNEPYGTDNTI